MQFPAPVSIEWIANLINAEVIGDKNAQAIGINEIHKVRAGDLVFVDHPKYYDKCINSAANFIIINSKEINPPQGKVLLFCENPFEAYQTITKHFRPFVTAEKSISNTAVIDATAVIMPQVVIGHHVTIGKNTIIHPNVTIRDYSVIGDNVVIQSGTVIGGDAFYYNGKKNRDVWYNRMHSCGNVIIEDNVEIGCNCTIDRGVTDSTIIGKGTIIDNLVHIGHDVVVGKNCLFAAQVGIAGATIIEDGVILWGQVGVNKTITIGANAVVFGQAGVTNSIEGNQGYWGTPAIPAKEKYKEVAWMKRIPAMWKKLME